MTVQMHCKLHTNKSSLAAGLSLPFCRLILHQFDDDSFVFTRYWKHEVHDTRPQDKAIYLTSEI